MADLTNLVDFKAEYSENLATPFSMFDENHTWNIISGGSNAVVENSSDRHFEGVKSIRTIFTGTDEVVFSSGGSEMNFTAPKDGNYFFSIRLFKELIDIDANVNFTLRLFINGITSLDTDLTADLYSSSGFVDGRWNTYAQSVQLVEGDEVTFVFKAQSDTTGSKFYIDGFKIELNDRNLTIPSIYSKPFEQFTGWQSRVDVVNTISLTADTDNLVSITGTVEQNGGLSLMNPNSKITPIKVGDVMQVDFACTFVTPAGTGNVVVIKLVVDGVAYRSFTYPLTKGAGNDDEFSISWSLPCGSSVFDNGAEIYLNPTESMTNKNRYISAVRTHKGI